MFVSPTGVIQLPVVNPQQQPSRASNVIKHAAVGAVAGAALGAGLSFTALPFIGLLQAPIAAAIGGVAGLVVGGIVGALRGGGGRRDTIVGSTMVNQVAPPAPGTGGGELPPRPPVH